LGKALGKLLQRRMWEDFGKSNFELLASSNGEFVHIQQSGLPLSPPFFE